VRGTANVAASRVVAVTAMPSTMMGADSSWAMRLWTAVRIDVSEAVGTVWVVPSVVRIVTSVLVVGVVWTVTLVAWPSGPVYDARSPARNVVVAGAWL
jgi:hypothetical protein